MLPLSKKNHTTVFTNVIIDVLSYIPEDCSKIEDFILKATDYEQYQNPPLDHDGRLYVANSLEENWKDRINRNNPTQSNGHQR